MKKIPTLSVPVLMLSLLLAGTAFSADKKGSAVEGRVVDRDGRPLAGVKVEAILPLGEDMQDHYRFEARTKADGKFVLQGLCPGTYYRIVFDNAGQCNDQRARIRSFPRGETMKFENDFVLIFSSFKVSSEGVIQDPRTGLEWASVPLMFVNYDSAATYAKYLRLAGGGWRLPTVEELKDLYESGQKGCGLDLAFANRYPKVWSLDSKSTSKLWLVKFSRNQLHTELWDQQSDPCDDCRVLPVRSPKQR